MKRFSATLLKMFVLFFVFPGTHTAYAQATTGSFIGVITDASGAVVSQAQVTATSLDTGLLYQASSDAVGRYAILSVPPGTYTVSAQKQGFELAKTQSVVLQIDQKIVQDFALVVGAVSTVATVTAEAPLLQTESVETGQVIDSQQILDLPLLGRNFLDLARLTSGVTSGSGGNTLNLSVNGQREFANSVLIDGVEATGNRNNDTNLRPSVDAVEEFKVATSDYSAEYGRASGGVISIQTKSGTNELHGDLFEFYRPNATAADNYSFSGPGQSPDLSQNNFGATFGGPIKKNKSFFSSLTNRNASGTTSLICRRSSAKPTHLQPRRQRRFVALARSSVGTVLPIYDPGFFGQNFYSQQFPGNVIPACPAPDPANGQLR